MEPVTGWAVLTELVVPLLGVAASTAVAIAALTVSRRATAVAEQARHAEARREDSASRLGFANELHSYLDLVTPSVVKRGKVEVGTYLVDRSAGANPTPTAQAVLKWFETGLVRIMEIRPPGDSPSEAAQASAIRSREESLTAFRREFLERLAAWVRDETLFGDAPFEHRLLPENRDRLT